jgi:hypothetical protein
MKKLLLAVLMCCAFGLQAQTPYGVYQVPFQPQTLNSGMNVNLNDDQFSGVVPIGFDFTFFDSTYSNAVISSNGYLTFDVSNANAFSNFAVSTSIPNPAATSNSIFCTWFDLNPGVSGSIRYGTVGSAPNRVFIVEYDSVALFACSQFSYSAQLQLFESSNNIEMHILSKPFCNSNGGLSSYAIEGIQNQNATVAYTVPGRNNSGVWQATQDAWRFDRDTTSAPVCIMSGQVFADFNGNCMVDGADYALPGQTLIRDNGMAFTQTNMQGAYSFEADTGNYTISFNGLSANLPYGNITCPANASYSVSYTNPGSVSDSLHFYVHPDSACSDARVHISPMGPLRRCAGNDNHQLVSITNNGLMPAMGYTVHITIPDSMYLYNTVPAYSSSNGNTYTWNFNDALLYGQMVNIHLYDSVSCYATDGVLKCMSASIETASDCDSSNNQQNVCQVLNGSYDPNHIQLLDTEPVSNYVYDMEITANQQWYTYRIQFQNTGTAPAQTVAVTDVLPSFFDPSSAELLSSSHNCILANTGDGTLRFLHYNINLPDSSADMAGSIGTVVFRVRTDMNLMPGQEVLNQASIVFDVNAPVITNQARIHWPEITGITGATAGLQLQPNPSNDFVVISGSVQGTLRMFDVSGRECLKMPVSGTQPVISVAHLPAGLYLVQMDGVKGSFTQRLIIQRN